MTKNFLNSVKAALNGLREALISERNFIIMLVIAVLVVVAMFYSPTTRLEKIALLFAIFSVLVLELINSTIERIMNVVIPEYDHRVKIIKDLMAATVLLASLGAALVGAFIFYILNLINSPR